MDNFKTIYGRGLISTKLTKYIKNQRSVFSGLFHLKAAETDFLTRQHKVYMEFLGKNIFKDDK